MAVSFEFLGAPGLTDMANRILGYMAAMCWFALAAFTVYGIVIACAGSPGIDMAMSTIFIEIGLYLIWHLMTCSPDLYRISRPRGDRR